MKKKYKKIISHLKSTDASATYFALTVKIFLGVVIGGLFLIFCHALFVKVLFPNVVEKSVKFYDDVEASRLVEQYTDVFNYE